MSTAWKGQDQVAGWDCRGPGDECLVDRDTGAVGVCSLLVVFRLGVPGAWPLWRSVQPSLLSLACQDLPWGI